MRARFNLFLLSIFFVNPAFSESHPSFGRLFNSPEQRASLDARRNQTNYKYQTIDQEYSEVKPSLPKTKDVEVSGYILREDGSAMVWINGHSELSGLNSSSLKVTVPSTSPSSVIVRTEGKIRALKPGQVWILDNNRVQESYQIAPPQSLPLNNAAESEKEE